MTIAPPSVLRASWRGRLSYDEAHALQLETRDAVARGERSPTLLLLEHEPVITVGRRGELDDLRVPIAEIERRGIAFRHAERGGRATYHGPGQLVGYLVAPLQNLAPSVGGFVCRLEDALIATASDLGVSAGRRPGQPGVWVGEAKLASVGIAVTRRACWHGFAMNVNLDVEPFGLIRPCGFDLPVTSIAMCVGSVPSVESVGQNVAGHLEAMFVAGSNAACT